MTLLLENAMTDCLAFTTVKGLYCCHRLIVVCSHLFVDMIGTWHIVFECESKQCRYITPTITRAIRRCDDTRPIGRFTGWLTCRRHLHL